MLNLKGGVKLKPKYSASDKFKPIIDMLQSPGANLSLLAYTSAKGFVFRLDVQPGNSAYLGYNRQRNAFTDEVLSLCLKLVVVYSPDPNDPNEGEGEPIDDFDNFGFPGNGFDPQIHKSTESKQSLFDEARYQQQAWKTSIIQNGVEVCPPVCNLALLDSQGSIYFLDFLQNIQNNSQRNKARSDKTIVYLRQQIKPNFAIGVLSMHTVVNSVDFFTFTETDDINTPKGLDMYKRLAAQTMRLFLQEKMIHCDLHTGNALVSDATTPPTCDIIDFGRVVRFTEHEKDQFFTVAQKQPLEARYDTELANYFSIVTPSRRGPAPPAKAQFVEGLLNYIKSVDLDVMRRHFRDENGRPLNRAQMRTWVDPYLAKGSREPIIFEATFDNLLVPYMTRTQGRSPSVVTVSGWEGRDMINLNIAKGITPLDFIVSRQELGLPSRTAAAGPVASGPVTSVKWSNGKLFLCAATVCTAVVVGTNAYYKLKEWGLMGGKSRRHKRNHHNKTKRNKK